MILEIICWDVVTAHQHRSWIFRTHEEIRPYVENIRKKPILIETLIDKLDKFLLD
jgi:hypothetical protein